MVMPIPAATWTREQVLALPDDGNRYELVDGELLVSPSPRGRHQRGVWKLYDRVKPFVHANQLGVTGLAPADLAIDGGQILQPDLFVAALIDGREPVDWADFGVPRLIAEILSPSTARYDRIVKRFKFQKVRVAEYWVVDLDARAIERWRPDDLRPELLDTTMVWEPDPNGPPLVIDLVEYFRDVWAESIRSTESGPG